MCDSKQLRYLISYVFCSLFALFPNGFYAATYTWNGSALDQNWDTATNWTPVGGPPLELNNDTALFQAGSLNYPNSGLVAGSGTIQFSGGASPITLQFTGTTLLSIGGVEGSITSSSGTNTIQGTSLLATLAPPFLIDVSAGSLTFQGSTFIPGTTLGISSLLNITGGGIVDFAGGNDFVNAPPSPSLSLSSGRLKVSHLGALGESVGLNPASAFSMSSSSLIIGVNGFAITTIPVTFNSSETIDTNGVSATVASVISGIGSLHKRGGGTLFLSGASNSYSGGTTIHAGTLNVAQDSNLGAAAGTLRIDGGSTLQSAASFNLVSGRTVFLNTGTANIDTNGFALGIGGPVIGSGLLNKVGGGTLFLTNPSNAYQGGTTVSNGTLNVLQDSNLGQGSLSLANGSTLQIGGSVSLADVRSVILIGGTAQLDSAGFNLAILGPITGSGGFNKVGLGSLTLSGANSYSGGTQVSTGSLIGNTSSLQGSITLSSGSSLVIDQMNAGIYQGTLSGPPLSSLTIQGGGSVSIGSINNTFFGQSFIQGNSSLILDGSLSESSLTIQGGSTLSGSGVIGTVVNSGQIVPGSSGDGSLSIQGALSFSGQGSLVSQITALGGAVVDVSGVANLVGAKSQIELLPGFYGLKGTRTLLTAGSVSGTFSSLSLDSRIQGNLIYNPTSVDLSFLILEPFLDFPFANANERAVGRNLDAIFLSSDLFLSPSTSGSGASSLLSIIDSLKGQSVASINDALDQMHPAAMSAFAELQTELGGQLLSLFHKNPSQRCGCSHSSRFWTLPFGNWLKEKKEGMEIGFRSTTRGVAAGFDQQFFGCWTLGIGGAYQASDLKWSLDRGYSYIRGAYGSLYTDLVLGNWYFGASGYVGNNWYDTARKLKFTIVDAQAKSNANGLDCGSQLMAAYFFGSPSCLLYPYATVDYLYLKNGSFSEKGAGSLDLEVEGYASSTLRAESGMTLRFVDRNRDDTICIAPLVSIGYVLDLPLKRDHYRSTFVNQTISFQTQGWDRAVQLLNLGFGLDLSYRCFTLQSNYSGDISPDTDTRFFNQRANFRLSAQF